MWLAEWLALTLTGTIWAYESVSEKSYNGGWFSNTSLAQYQHPDSWLAGRPLSAGHRHSLILIYIIKFLFFPIVSLVCGCVINLLLFKLNLSSRNPVFEALYLFLYVFATVQCFQNVVLWCVCVWTWSWIDQVSYLLWVLISSKSISVFWSIFYTDQFSLVCAVPAN